jgi:glucose-6-phosphate isomerase
MCAAMAGPQQPGGTKTLKQLFQAEPDRLSRFTFDIAGAHFDWSKTHLDAALLDQFLTRAEQAGFAAARDALFSGDIVNPSEGRPATHVAERGSGAPEEADLAAARRARMRALVDAIEAGAFGALTGILHIGIGGSVLGPALLVDALGRRTSNLTVRFLSNIDGAAFEDAVEPLDPATTLVVAASKTFSTLETLANLDAARAWLRAAGVSDPDGQVVAVTAKPEAAVAQGIDESRILQFGDGVGGRYSLWSSVGLSAALTLGWDAFETLLEGAAEMDRHFRFAEPRDNVPLIAAFADRLYGESFGCCPSTSSSSKWNRTASRSPRTDSRSRIPRRRSRGAAPARTRSMPGFSCSTRGPCSCRSSSWRSATATIRRTRNITACSCSTPSRRARRLWRGARATIRSAAMPAIARARRSSSTVSTRARSGR